jgi:sugar phosphate isomerase/epimerase
MMGNPELIGLYWTLSGPVEVHTGREWSLFDFADRCEQAASAGFQGVGLWHADLRHVLETRSLPEMRTIMSDNGLEYLELEFLGDWFFDADDDRRKASDELRELLWQAAAILPAHHVKVGNLAGNPCPLPQVVERFAELCADAAENHDAKIVYEFMPYDANVNSIDTVLEVVEGAGADNGGIACDIWHLAKLELTPEDLHRIPLEYLSWVELCDGPGHGAKDRLDEVINHRKLPGEGEWDLPGYIRAFREIGYAEPWGVEVLSQELRALPLEEICRRAHDTAAAALEVA